MLKFISWTNVIYNAIGKIDEVNNYNTYIEEEYNHAKEINIWQSSFFAKIVKAGNNADNVFKRFIGIYVLYYSTIFRNSFIQSNTPFLSKNSNMFSILYNHAILFIIKEFMFVKNTFQILEKDKNDKNS